MSRASKLGVIGERLACNHLINQGFKIRERNYKHARSEIDIIAEKGKAIYFIEVKTRGDDLFGSPLESVPLWKQRRILNAARYYAGRNGLEGREIHFSVIGIITSECDKRIEFIEDAFFDE